MKNDRMYLLHILECIQNINHYLPNRKDDYFSSKMVQDAMIGKMEVIGEATKRISNELKLKHKDIPWKEMAGLRDVLIHNYFGVDNQIVWNVVENELPLLKKSFNWILNSL